MPSVIDQWRDTRAATTNAATRDIVTIDDYATALSGLYADTAAVWGFAPGSPQWKYEPAERVSYSFEGYASQLVDSNGAVAAIIGVRVLAFSLVRFAHQRLRNGRPAGLFGMPNLGLLERPFPGGTTQDLLMRMMQDVDLAGNAYVTAITGIGGPELLRLRPDWVQIILLPITKATGEIIGYRRVGYTYHEGGIELCPPEEVALFDVREVAHFAPDPDPSARFRGQSWLTAAIREIINDKMMERHKTKFFENAATPNISVALSDAITPAQFAEFKEKMDLEHRGVDNAYKTLFLGGGADVKVIGAQLQQIDFAAIQGRGETRIAARAGVPPIIVGLSEGLSASTYSNYGLAMRRFGDLTMAALWRNAAGSLETLVPPPGSDARLWYDTRDVAFLRDDAKARADVAAVKAGTISSYITSGFTPESAVEAADAEDPTLLVHTGLVSVQLQPPGQAAPTASGDGGGTPAPTTAPATNGTKAVRLGKEPPETGELDAVDRQLHLTGQHPHPRLAETNGG
jgi:phage portal protein BeeE